MTFATNRSVTGLMHIRVDGEPDVIRRQNYKGRQPYVDRDDWAYNLDVYEVYGLVAEESAWS